MEDTQTPKIFDQSILLNLSNNVKQQLDNIEKKLKDKTSSEYDNFKKMLQNYNNDLNSITNTCKKIINFKNNKQSTGTLEDNLKQKLAKKIQLKLISLRQLIQKVKRFNCRINKTQFK